MGKELIDINELYEAHKAEQAQLKKDWVHQVRADNGTFGTHQADATNIENDSPPEPPVRDNNSPFKGDSETVEGKVESTVLNPLTWKPFGQEASAIGDLGQTPSGSGSDITRL